MRGYEEDLRSAGGITQEVADKQLESFQAKMQLLWSRVMDAAIAIGEPLADALSEIVDRLEPFIAHVGNLADRFNKLDPSTKTIILSVAALAAAIGPVLIVLGFMATSIAGLISMGPLFTTILKGIGFAMKGMLGPIGLVATAVVLLINHFELWDEIGAILKRVGQWLWSWKDTVVNVFKAIADPIQTAIDIFQWFSDTVVGNSILPEFVDAVAAEFDRMGVAMVDRTDAAALAVQERLQAAAAEQLAQLDANANLYLQRELALFKAQEAQEKEYLQLMSDVRNAAGMAQFEAAAAEQKALADQEKAYQALMSDVRNETGLAQMEAERERLEGRKSNFASFFKSLITNTSKAMGELQDKVSGGLMSLFGGGEGKGGGLMADIVGSGLSMVFGPASGLVSKFVTAGMNKMMGIVKNGLGKIGGWFKGLFGGANAQEMGGREVAREFERTVSSMRNGLHQIEIDTLIAQGHNKVWAETAVTVKNAYLEAGMTAEDALNAVDRLWKAEKQGGDAVRVVMEEILGVMNSVTDQTDILGDTFEDAAGKGEKGFEQLGNTVREIGVREFPNMSDAARRELDEIAFADEMLRNQMSQPISRTVTTVMETVHKVSGARAGERSWRERADDPALREAIDNFLEGNIGDRLRIPSALGISMADVERLGYEHGTGGSYVDFGAGRSVRLHGRERVMTEREGRTDAEKFSALLAEMVALRQDQQVLMRDLPRQNAVALRDALVLAR
jgi:hypothetical protein